MKVITKKKSKTIRAKTADSFDRQFQEASDSIDEEYDLVWDSAPMCVHFIWEEKIRIPESLTEKFELEGLQRFCKDCPNFIKGKDRRYRGQGCRLTDGRTEYSPACELFYRGVVDGTIKLMKED